ncbi:MAG: glycosyltransferase [Proteobacteria bacterium]|nr:glycosyltransferase [Pseudomonadota bacterium]
MDDNSPLVSVIVPTFNCRDFIVQALQSILNQTYPKIEVIVIDDGSTDDTQSVLSPFRRDKRIKYFYQSNAGQAAARNKGLSLANGTYIAFLDADDQWQPTKIAKQIAQLSHSRNGVVYSNFQIIDGVTGKSIAYHRGTRYEQLRYGKVTYWLSFFNFIPFSSVMVRRDCIQKVGSLDDRIKMGDDWDLLLRLSVYFRFDFVDEPLLIYRMGRAQQLSANMSKRFEQQDLIIQKFFISFPGLFSKRHIRRTASVRYCFRGRFYSHHDFKKSLYLYLEAFRLNPTNLVAIKGIIRLFAIQLGLKHN